jgi:hypothetical protein
VASTNKCLAQNNKSCTGVKATKKRRSLPAVKLIELIEEIVDESAPGTNKTAAIEAEAREDDKVKMVEFCARWSE